MASSTKAPQAAPVITRLSYDAPPGGYSSFLSGTGKYFAGGGQHTPDNARVLEALAVDPSSATLELALADEGYGSVSTISTMFWVAEAFTVIVLLLVIPIVCFMYPKRKKWVLLFLGLTTGLFLCLGGLLLLLMAMFGTRSNMVRTLDTELPQTYSWLFQNFLAYVLRTSNELIHTEAALNASAATDIQNRILGETAETQAAISLVQGNISKFDEKFDVYENVQSTVATWFLLPTGVLALVITITLIVCFAGFYGFARANSGKQTLLGPVFLVTGVLLLSYNLIALPYLIYLLPWCTLGQGNVCGPYEDRKYGVLDDGIQKLWPTQSRAEPYNRLVPSIVLEKCDKPGKSVLDLAPVDKTKKSDWNIEYAVPPPQKAPDPAAAANASAPAVGDCSVVENMITAGMTALCPLFVDDLVGYWAAHFYAVFVAFVAAVLCFIMAIKFMASTKKQKRKRKRGRYDEEDGDDFEKFDDAYPPGDISHYDYSIHDYSRHETPEDGSSRRGKKIAQGFWGPYEVDDDGAADGAEESPRSRRRKRKKRRGYWDDDDGEGELEESTKRRRRRRGFWDDGDDDLTSPLVNSMYVSSVEGRRPKSRRRRRKRKKKRRKKRKKGRKGRKRRRKRKKSKRKRKRPAASPTSPKQPPPQLPKSPTKESIAKVPPPPPTEPKPPAPQPPAEPRIISKTSISSQTRVVPVPVPIPIPIPVHNKSAPSRSTIILSSRERKAPSPPSQSSSSLPPLPSMMYPPLPPPIYPIVPPSPYPFLLQQNAYMPGRTGIPGMMGAVPQPMASRYPSPYPIRYPGVSPYSAYPWSYAAASYPRGSRP
ncbi:uncharacterized protein LOC135367920 [Ornithodoros turicata]|uniref:uncharacterized protein LOC135367920 n=1 Tax=Ornithodoros turicata TaxID=34597 RepID=UPI003138B469